MTHFTYCGYTGQDLLPTLLRNPAEASEDTLIGITCPHSGCLQLAAVIAMGDPKGRVYGEAGAAFEGYLQR